MIVVNAAVPQTPPVQQRLLSWLRIVQAASWAAQPGTPEHDRLEVLGILVQVYQDEHLRIEHPDPIEAIKFMMEQNGKSKADFARLVGSAVRAAEMLRRRRPLTLSVIRALEREWRIPASVLVQPYRREKRAA